MIERNQIKTILVDKIAPNLDTITIVVAIWFVIYPKPYNLLLGLLILIPIVNVIINIFKDKQIVDLIDIDIKNYNDYRWSDFIDIGAFSIMYRIARDFEVVNIRDLLIPTISCFIILIVLILSTHVFLEKNTHQRSRIYNVLIFKVLLFSLVSIYASNAAFDCSKAACLIAIVEGKQKKRKKRKSFRRYYVTVSYKNRNSSQKKEKIKISKEQYYKISSGHNLKVCVKDGLFGISWRYVETIN